MNYITKFIWMASLGYFTGSDLAGIVEIYIEGTSLDIKYCPIYYLISFICGLILGNKYSPSIKFEYKNFFHNILVILFVCPLLYILLFLLFMILNSFIMIGGDHYILLFIIIGLFNGVLPMLIVRGEWFSSEKTKSHGYIFLFLIFFITFSYSFYYFFISRNILAKLLVTF